MYPLRRGPEQLEGPLIPSPPQISCFFNYVIFLATVVLTVRQLTVRIPTSHAGIQRKSRKNPVVRRERWGTLGIHILLELPVFSDVCHHALS